MRPETEISLRVARETDLDALNAVVSACVMSWNLPERVKRLSLRSYCYTAFDLEHLEIQLALTKQSSQVIGVAAWEAAVSTDLPTGKSGLLLHGLYVDPQFQNRGIGRRLVEAVMEVAQERSVDGLLVKAQPDAVGFFRSLGFRHVPVETPERDYPYRWWKSLPA